MNLDKPQFTNAEHILEWALNSQEHWQAILALYKYPREGNFATNAALNAFSIANGVYRLMYRGNDLRDASSQDILEAAKLMLDWKPEELTCF